MLLHYLVILKKIIPIGSEESVAVFLMVIQLYCCYTVRSDLCVRLRAGTGSCSVIVVEQNVYTSSLVTNVYNAL